MALKTHRHPARRDVVSFAAIVAIGFSLVALLVWRRGRPLAAERIAAIAWAASLLSIVVPSAGRVLYAAWMAVGAAMGFVTSRVALTVMYFAVLTPVGLWLRLRGRDALGRRRRPGAASYWADHPKVDGPDATKHLY